MKEGWTDRVQTNIATQEKLCAIFCEKRKRDQTHVSCIGRQILYHWATWEARYIISFIINDNGGLLCPDYLENNSKSLPWKWSAAVTNPWKRRFRIRQCRRLEEWWGMHTRTMCWRCAEKIICRNRKSEDVASRGSQIASRNLNGGESVHEAQMELREEGRTLSHRGQSPVELCLAVT